MINSIRIIVFFILSLIVSNTSYSQNKPKDLRIRYRLDTTQINNLYYIGLALENEIEKNDSLLVQLKRSNEIIKLLDQQAKESLSIRKDLKEVIRLTNLNYTSLNKDYQKLKKGNLINGVLGGGISTAYDTQSQTVNNVAIKLNLGLMFKRKYLTSIDVGINLNKQIVFGLNFQNIF